MTSGDIVFSSVVEALLDPEKGKETPFLVIPTVFLNSLPHSSLASFVCPVFPSSLHIILWFGFTKYILHA